MVIVTMNKGVIRMGGNSSKTISETSASTAMADSLEVILEFLGIDKQGACKESGVEAKAMEVGSQVHFFQWRRESD